MNFALPNRDLERIWGLPLNLAASWRHQRRLGPPQWKVKGGLAGVKRRGELGEYLRALKTERKKGEAFATLGVRDFWRLVTSGT